MTSSRLGGNPYCKNIDSNLKSSVCRFNGSSPYLPGTFDSLKHVKSLNPNKLKCASYNQCNFLEVEYNSNLNVM